jgi:hypothetical protein
MTFDPLTVLPKRKVKSRNEVEELREENRQLRELAAQLSKLTLQRINSTASPASQ